MGAPVNRISNGNCYSKLQPDAVGISHAILVADPHAVHVTIADDNAISHTRALVDTLSHAHTCIDVVADAHERVVWVTVREPLSVGDGQSEPLCHAVRLCKPLVVRKPASVRDADRVGIRWRQRLGKSQRVSDAGGLPFACISVGEREPHSVVVARPPAVPSEPHSDLVVQPHAVSVRHFQPVSLG